MNNGYGYSNGWPGAPGIQLFPLSSCGCGPSPCPPTYCGCPIQLDSGCLIYHKNMNVATALINLNLPNGSTGELIFNTIDAALGPINVNTWVLTFLRSLYTITSLPQFGVAVDTQFSLLASQIATLTTAANTPITSTPSTSIIITPSGSLGHVLSAAVRISATANNTVSVLSDGIYGTPQTLAVDYINKNLTISGGNTVSLSSLVCGASGFLGNVATDPTAIDGQYWWNTTSSTLKIHVNGIVKTITTV